MPRRARIHFSPIRSSLVNLPISIYGPLLERNIRPQNLAVHLILASQRNGHNNSKVEAYVGWTGMASASSLAHFNEPGDRSFETLEIDPQYAQDLGFSQGDLVEIGLLHDLALADSVGTEPLTSDDWEIIEIHASHVESTLLSQVRVAKIGQEINVWVLGRTRVRLRVVSLNSSSKGNPLLLATNTEVSVAPKQHASQKSTLASTNRPARESNSTETPSRFSNSKSGALEKTKNLPSIVRVLPRRLLTQSLTLVHDSELVGYVSKHTLSRIICSERDHASSSPGLPSGDDTVVCKAYFKRLDAPSDTSQYNAPAPDPTGPPNRTLVPKTNVDKLASPATGAESFLFLSSSSNVPDNHIVFVTIPEGVEEWDLVRLVRATGVPTLTAMNGVLPEEQETPEEPIFLAGIDDLLKKCISYCENKLTLHSSSRFIQGVSALLLTGRSGTGKTSMAQYVARSLQRNPKSLAYIHYVDFSRYSEKPVLFLKSFFQQMFEKVMWHRPSILILDNMDKLLSAELEHADSFRSRHLTEVFLHQYSSACRIAASNFRGVIIIGTAISSMSLHPLINNMHIFEEEIHVKPPNKDARRDIFAKLVRDRLKTVTCLQPDVESPLNYMALATLTEGYSPTDIKDLVAKAVHQAAMRSAKSSGNTALQFEDFEAAQVGFTPLSLRDVKLQKSDVKWADIGGLYETKKTLRETMEWPTKYGPIFAQSPLRLRSGLLLYGFPGCGKTLLASAVARECGLNFISIKGPELLNKYIGASEKSVRDLFESASATKPCVLFFDEFDSIAPKRGHDSTGVTDRVVNQMLTQMDGAEGLDGVYVLAATSRPDLIDPALLRPGRLDKSLLCGMPDLEERKDILVSVARKVRLSEAVDLGEIARATEGFTGADLQALLYNAHLEVVHSSIAALPSVSASSGREEKPIPYVITGGPKEDIVSSRATELVFQSRLRQIRNNSAMPADGQRSDPPPPKIHEITPDHISAVLKTARPSVTLDEQRRLDRIYKAFVGSRSGDLPVPPDGVGIGNRVSLM